jgi:hypothetical protein
MRNPAALEAALALMRRPQMVRQARHSPLPEGIMFVLEIAIGEADALAAAGALTGRTERSLIDASAFFIEQVLLIRDADSYRILGAKVDASSGELRRNMALLMHWLHPDIANSSTGGKIDRSVFANLVTRAWEDLKTDERRAAYDAKLSGLLEDAGARSDRMRRGARRSPAKLALPPKDQSKQKRSRRHLRLTMFRISQQSFISRLLGYLRGGR